MKINVFLLLVMMTISFGAAAQEQRGANQSAANEDIYTSLRPADAQPVQFSSQVELDAKIQYKKDNMIALIGANRKDTAMVRLLRYELWRFENAIVVPPNESK
jgi:uncharacterized protein YdeI (BOF family)